MSTLKQTNDWIKIAEKKPIIGKQILCWCEPDIEDWFANGGLKIFKFLNDVSRVGIIKDYKITHWQEVEPPVSRWIDEKT